MLLQLPGRCLLLLFALFLAGSCQRASYSFQPVASGAATSTVLAAADTLRAASPALASQPRAARAAPLARPRRQLARRVVAIATSQLLRTARALPATARPRAYRPSSAGSARGVADLPPYRGRSRGLALLLAGIPLLLGFPIGLHDFYLGYPGRGIAKLLLLATAYVLLALGAVGLFVGVFFGGSGSAATLFILGSILYVGVFIWQFADFILILTNGLQPHYGEYYRRPFQMRPEAEPPTR